MKEKLTYKYVCERTSYTLAEEVNKLIDLGWEVSGDPSVSIAKHQGTTTLFLQRMKTNQEK